MSAIGTAWALSAARPAVEALKPAARVAAPRSASVPGAAAAPDPALSGSSALDDAVRALREWRRRCADGPDVYESTASPQAGIYCAPATPKTAAEITEAALAKSTRPASAGGEKIPAGESAAEQSWQALRERLGLPEEADREEMTRLAADVVELGGSLDYLAEGGDLGALRALIYENGARLSGQLASPKDRFELAVRVARVFDGLRALEDLRDAPLRDEVRARQVESISAGMALNEAEIARVDELGRHLQTLGLDLTFLACAPEEAYAPLESAYDAALKKADARYLSADVEGSAAARAVVADAFRNVTNILGIRPSGAGAAEAPFGSGQAFLPFDPAMANSTPVPASGSAAMGLGGGGTLPSWLADANAGAWERLLASVFSSRVGGVGSSNRVFTPTAVAVLSAGVSVSGGTFRPMSILARPDAISLSGSPPFSGTPNRLAGTIPGNADAGAVAVQVDGVTIEARAVLSWARVDDGAGIMAATGRIDFSAFYDPLVLDLAGDGLNLRSAEGGVDFDYDGGGVRRRGGFIQNDDALLFLATEENGGLVRDGSDLFGDADGHAHGFAKLAFYDANGDFLIDENDEIWNFLRVWQDWNGDGVCDENEVKTLAEAGVSALALNYVDGLEADGSGNYIAQRGGFIRTDGTTGSMADILFRAETAGGQQGSPLFGKF